MCFGIQPNRIHRSHLTKNMPFRRFGVRREKKTKKLWKSDFLGGEKTSLRSGIFSDGGFFFENHSLLTKFRKRHIPFGFVVRVKKKQRTGICFRAATTIATTSADSLGFSKKFRGSKCRNP